MTASRAGLDFTPKPGAAPLAAQALSQARMEARLLLRNGEQLLLAVVIPILLLVAGTAVPERVEVTLSGRPIDVLTPGVLALAVMSTSFTALAIATGFERRAGLLRRLAVSPLTRSALLLGKVGALLIVELVQCLLIAAVGLGLGWRPDGPGLLLIVPLMVLGTATFAGLGLALAGTLRAEATLAAANLVNVLLLVGGAIVWPRSAYGAAEDWLVWLPSAALGDVMRAASQTGTLDLVAISVLAAWAVAGAAIAARWFRWD